MQHLVPLTFLLFAGAASAQLPVHALWPLDETTGTTATDAGPHGNHGTLVNFTGTPWVTAHSGNGLQFDGVDDYVDVARNGGLPLYRGLGAPYSITCWVKAPAQDDKRIYAEGNATLNSQQLFSLGSGRVADNPAFGSRLRLYIRNNAGVEVAKITSASTVFDDTWHHIAFVDVAGAAVLYVDGVADTQSFDYRVRGGTTTASNGTNQPTYGSFSFDRVSLGSVLRWNAVACLRGTLDDVRIFGSALSAVDVALVMAGGMPPVCSASAGSFGVPCGAVPMQIAAGGGPVLGQTLSLQLTGGSNGALGLLLVGLGNLQRFDLGAFGYSGCTLYVPNPSANAVGVVSAAPLSVGLPVPAIGTLLGVPVAFQGAALASSVELSRAVVGQIGL